jgi:hypothetical protein
MKRILPDIFILIIALIVSYVSVCLSIPSIYTPASNYASFKGIRPDKWLADGAEIKLPGLLGRGNYLQLNFENWFPEVLTSPQARVKVCGEVASEFYAHKGGSQTVYLTGDCEPRIIKFNILNPFSLNASDVRKLGLRIDSIELTSKLGFPLSSLENAMPVILTLLACIVFLRIALNPSIARAGAVALILFAAFLIPNQYFDNYISLIGLMLIGVSISFGLILGKRIDFNVVNNTSCANFNSLLFLLVLFAGMIRFYGIDFGLPYNYHPDEVPKFNAIMNMRAAGDLNPRYFLHPSLLLYSTYGMNSILRFFYAFDGQWSDTLIFSGRIVSASAGTITVLLTGLTACMLWGRLCGLLSALLLAFTPLHVTVSRYVKEDALLTFFVMLCVFLIVYSVRRSKPSVLLLAGLAAGFSAGVKYTGAVTGALIVLSPWLKSQSFKPDKTYLKFALRACFLVPIGFILSTPYSVLDLGTFIKGFSYEKNHMEEGHGTVIDPWSQLWMYHVVRSLIPGFQYLPLIIALIGAGAFFRKKYFWGWFLICGLLIFYLPAEYVKAKPAPQPERYVVPCLPFLSILAATFLAKFYNANKGVDRLIVVLLILLTPVLSIYRTFALASEIRTDSRDTMRSWISTHIPADTHILVDWKAYAPFLDDLNLKVEYLPQQQIIPSLSVKSLKQSGADYLLVTSLFYDRYLVQPNVPPLMRLHIEGLFDNFKTVAEVTPKYGTYGFHNPTLKLLKLK